MKKSTDTVEKVENEHEKIIMNPEVEIIKPEVTIIEPEISSSPDIEKQSVKKIHAMFKNGPFALPMLTPESIKNLPKSPTKTKTEELKTPDSDQDFTFEKQKIVLRQRTKNAKRPISKKFRNSMQISSNSQFEELLNQEMQ